MFANKRVESSCLETLIEFSAACRGCAGCLGADCGGVDGVELLKEMRTFLKTALTFYGSHIHTHSKLQEPPTFVRAVSAPLVEMTLLIYILTLGEFRFL